MLSTLLVTPVLALTSGPALEGPQHLESAPPPGALLVHEHFVQHILTTRAMRYRAEGAEQIEERGLDLSSRLDLVASDRILEAGDGRPARFRRSYDRARLRLDLELVGVGRGGANPKRVSSRGTFEGKSVVFTWIEEEQDYGRYYDAEEGIEEDLARLLPPLDLAGFLPLGPIEPGAAWEIDPLELRHVVGPGGYLGFDLAELGDPHLLRAVRGGIGTHVYEAFEEHREGELTATFSGTREVDGRELAVIEVLYEVGVKADLTPLMRLALTTAEVEAGVELRLVELNLDLAGQGEILWDLEGKHMASASFEGSQSVRTLIRTQLGGAGVVQEQELELGGSFTSEARSKIEQLASPMPEPTGKK